MFRMELAHDGCARQAGRPSCRRDRGELCKVAMKTTTALQRTGPSLAELGKGRGVGGRARMGRERGEVKALTNRFPIPHHAPW